MIRIPWYQTRSHSLRFSATWLTALWLLGALLPRPAAAVVFSEDVTRLQETIRALHRVYEKSDEELQQQKDTGRLSDREQSEFATFIRYIGGRIAVYCRQLYQVGGVESLADLSCPAGGSNAGGQAVASTVEEIAVLEASLADSLGDFDEMLLAEEQRAAARQPRRSATGAGAAAQGGQEGTEGDSGLQGRTNGASQGGQGQESTGDTEVSSPQSSPDSTGGGRGGGESGQGGAADQAGQDRLTTDDDIVARQLREAAEKETDPELKKKLWEEYRKYKAGK